MEIIFFEPVLALIFINSSISLDTKEILLGIKSSFVRTPKFNVGANNDAKENKYDKKSLSILNIGEGLLMLLFTYTAITRTIYGDLGMVPFHLMLAFGYGLVFYHSIAELRPAKSK